MFSPEIWFVKTSTRIMKYKSRIVKSNPVEDMVRLPSQYKKKKKTQHLNKNKKIYTNAIKFVKRKVIVYSSPLQKICIYATILLHYQ